MIWHFNWRRCTKPKPQSWSGSECSQCSYRHLTRPQSWWMTILMIKKKVRHKLSASLFHQANQMPRQDESIQMQKLTDLKGKAIYQYKNTQEICKGRGKNKSLKNWACCGIWVLLLFCSAFGSGVTSLALFVWSLIYRDWMQCESFMNKYDLCFYTTLNLSQFILTWRHCRGPVRFPSGGMIYCLGSWESKVIKKTIIKRRRKRKHERVTGTFVDVGHGTRFFQV